LAVSSALSPTTIPQDQHLALARGERLQHRAEPLGEFLGEQALLGAVVQHWSLGQLCRNVARDGGSTPSSSRSRIVSDLLVSSMIRPSTSVLNASSVIASKPSEE
jgi:hypothetical protein